MILREEIQQFMDASENLLGYSVQVEELTNVELELIKYYLIELSQKFPALFVG